MLLQEPAGALQYGELRPLDVDLDELGHEQAVLGDQAVERVGARPSIALVCDVHAPDGDVRGQGRVQAEVSLHPLDGPRIGFEARHRRPRLPSQHQRVVGVVAAQVEAAVSGAGEAPDVTGELDLGGPQVGLKWGVGVGLQAQAAAQAERDAKRMSRPEEQRAHGRSDRSPQGRECALAQHSASVSDRGWTRAQPGPRVPRPIPSGPTVRESPPPDPWHRRVPTLPTDRTAPTPRRPRRYLPLDPSRRVPAPTAPGPMRSGPRDQPDR